MLTCYAPERAYYSLTGNLPSYHSTAFALRQAAQGAFAHFGALLRVGLGRLLLGRILRLFADDILRRQAHKHFAGDFTRGFA